jgi:D-2-hydroxyglutarate dehydrogenase
LKTRIYPTGNITYRNIHLFFFTGDSNLHLNVACKNFNPEIYKAVEPFVFEYVSKLKGSISAEHGIGFQKTKYLLYSKSPEAIAFMKQIKQLMDPNAILNPYKVLPLN